MMTMFQCAKAEMLLAIIFIVIRKCDTSMQRGHSLRRITSALHIHGFVWFDLTYVKAEDISQQATYRLLVARCDQPVRSAAPRRF
jgi:hypothetical protein